MERNTPTLHAHTFLHDLPAENDTLGRTPFAKVLARSLPLPKESPGLVVGIEGSWGSGKSTLIHLITAELQSNSTQSAPVVVLFNPWMVSTTGALVESLISQIAVAIGADSSAGEKGVKAGAKLLGYIAIFNKLKYLKYVPGTAWAGNIAEAVDELFKVSEEVVETGGKTLDEMKKILPAIDLAGQKKAVVKALKELDRAIVIVVDDLDRLLPTEIQAMMQAIKSVADFPRTTYLLAYDRSVVASALGSNETAGIEYLAKIVQVAYPIPPLFNRQRTALFNQKIRAFLSRHSIELSSFENEIWDKAISILVRLLPQPRDIVRLINRLILSIPASRGEVNAVDVIVFEAISMRYPALRDAVYQNSHDFAGRFHDDEDAVELSRYYHFDRKSRTGTETSSWQHHLPADQPAVLAACEFLFSKNTIFARKNIDHLRIADPYRLARLLRMTSIEGVPEVSEINEMLKNPTELATTLASCDTSESLSLLTWICNYVHNCSNSDIEGSIRVLFEHVRNFEPSGTLDADLINQIDYTISLLMSIDHVNSDKILILLAEEAPLAIAATPIAKYQLERNRGENFSARPGPSEAVIVQAVNLLLPRIRKWIVDDAPGSSQQVHTVLNTFYLLTKSYEEVHAATKKLCASDEWLSTFVAGFSDDPQRTMAFRLVGDVEILADRIESTASLVGSYGWLINILRSPKTIEMQALNRSLPG